MIPKTDRRRVLAELVEEAGDSGDEGKSGALSSHESSVLSSMLLIDFVNRLRLDDDAVFRGSTLCVGANTVFVFVSA